MREIRHLRKIIAVVVVATVMSAVAVAESCSSELALGTPTASGRILFARGGETWVMDGNGQHQRPILKNVGMAALSPDGIHIAYWSGKAVRILSLADGCDVVVDETLKPSPTDIGWSGNGKTLGYVGTSDIGAGLHVVPFPVTDSRAKVFPYFNRVSLSHDGRYALTSTEATTRVDLLTGSRTVIYAGDNTHSPWGASYSRTGDVVAVLYTIPVPEATDDEPDCRGASTALRILAESGAIDVPFPEGFSSTLDYEFDFSPDGKEIAISFGAERCDYPGDIAAVYLFSLADRKLTRITPKDQLAGRVKFSPDGKALIYTHFVGTGTTAIYRYDLNSGIARRLTSPRDDDYDYVIDWR